MKLFVGLGNPGREHKNNRHNVGCMLVDRTVADRGLSWTSEGKFKADLAKDPSTEDVFAKPQTFMNKSGEAVAALVNFFKLDPKDLVILYDDVDLDFGRIKKQFGGRSAGHHGIESILEKLGTEMFWRVRFGIGRPVLNPRDVYNWVLTNFSKEELDVVAAVNLTDLLDMH
ncbi:MAG: hypothetical protein ACD_22C00033G0002 [uncultured bacterium]|uniref:Peptidyl-tRNA hydrolase n=1 Tax=candidate division WWE3 bacterium RBG_16_37_10 TaxID=1802610 RepID=A0A1F4UVR8_UNCKA|nr:MAG: hypothetical protein ACD_22C00033G0002 [uncultured bacterium]OGC48976.1 MAG: aminoacyl-tRNA hydrolase [candidate division WWE3 bacterium RBG_16_37_10]